MEKITIHGTHNGVIEIQKKIEQLGADDRRETVFITGGVQSVSDGYHTFDELYTHRIALWIALCGVMSVRYPVNPVWRTKTHSDGTSYDGWFVLGMFQDNNSQMTYHLPVSEWDNTNFAVTLEKAPEFDGHTPSDVIERLAKL